MLARRRTFWRHPARQFAIWSSPRPRPASQLRGVGDQTACRQLHEARQSGNIELDPHADWLDYEGAGVADPDALSRRVTQVLAHLDLEETVYTLGLRWRLDREAHPEAAARLLEARKALASRLVEDGITNLVETYDPERFNLTPRWRRTCSLERRSDPCLISKRSLTTATYRRFSQRLGLSKTLSPLESM